MNKTHKTIKRLTIISIIITIISGAVHFLLPLLLFKKYLVEVAPGSASSIGIIGGADGPTSIFIAGKTPNHLLITIVFGVVSIIDLIYLLIHKYREK